MCWHIFTLTMSWHSTYNTYQNREYITDKQSAHISAIGGDDLRSQVHRMTPLLPEKADALQDLALDVIQKSAALGNRQHPLTLETLRELLRIINSYYSNLIEA